MYKPRGELEGWSHKQIKLVPSVSIDLECRYKSIITTTSAELDIVRPTEAPKNQLEVQFEHEVKTTFETKEELKDQDSDYYKQVASQVVAELEKNWQGGEKPYKIEIGGISFIYNDLVQSSENRIRQDPDLMVQHGSLQGQLETPPAGRVRTDDESTDDKLVSVKIKFFYKVITKDTKQTEPTKDDVKEYKQNIVDTFGYQIDQSKNRICPIPSRGITFRTDYTSGLGQIKYSLMPIYTRQ